MLTFYQMVGQRIFDVLKEMGWTQQQLADSIGISKQVMSKILNGDKNTTILEIRDIADVLNVPVQQLLMPIKEEEYHVEIEEETNEGQVVPLFNGEPMTEVGSLGVQRAMQIIELILECENLFVTAQKNRHQKVNLTGIQKVRSFRPTTV